MEPVPQETAPKSKFWKFVGGFLAIIVLAIIGLWGLAHYERYLSTREVDRLAEAMKQFERGEYEAAMADTYGGKTPEETLSLYIAAVEKGDYELASKYFIESRQEGELRSLKKSLAENLTSYITRLKETQGLGGVYSLDKKQFSFNGDVLVRLLVYPNGVWKLIDKS